MNGTLPYWLERWLGIDAASGEGTAWTIDFLWPLSAWATVLLIALVACYVVGIYLRENRQSSFRRRMTLAAMRLASAAILLMMLAQVSLGLKRTGLPHLAVLLDNSESMTIADPGNEKLAAQLRDGMTALGTAKPEPTRWNLARALLLERERRLLTALQADYKLRFYYLADTPSGARAAVHANLEPLAEQLRAAEASVQSTRLGDALQTILDDFRGTAPAAIVALTDGITTEGVPLDDGAASAARRGVPLFLVAVGDDAPVRDVKLTDLLVDDLVFVGDILHFEARLSATGLAGETATVVLGKEGESEPLARQTVVLEPDGRGQTVRVTHRPQSVGQFRYTLEVEPLDGELQTENNRQQRTVTVSDEKIRVLLVQAYPSFEFRYLWNMLSRAETSVELHAVLQQADPELLRPDAESEPGEPIMRPFPLRKEELFSYDVILFGDVQPSLISESMLEGIAEFVDRPGRGGAVVFIAGPQFTPTAYRDTPLARLFPSDPGSVRLPVPDEPIEQGFAMRPTELGLLSPPMQLELDPLENARTWERLAPLYWFAELGDLKPGVRVLAVH
ncbi:MAG: vWA domain-containing protein, partial [Patescibacteria group bacterium]|nr:vWA domain-containing protein [Patescibacteria group bacterium]